MVVRFAHVSRTIREREILRRDRNSGRYLNNPGGLLVTAFQDTTRK